MNSNDPQYTVNPGTSSLQDDFVINEAGSHTQTGTGEITAEENPILQIEQAPKPDAQSSPLSARFIQDALPKASEWSHIPPATAHFIDKAYSSEIWQCIVLFICLPALIIVLIVVEIFFLQILMFILVIANFYAVLLSIKRIVKLRHNSELKFTIHNDEIILEEISKNLSQFHSFPRNPNCLVIKVTELIPEKLGLSTVTFITYENSYTLPKAFRNYDARQMNGFLTTILTTDPNELNPEKRYYF